MKKRILFLLPALVVVTGLHGETLSRFQGSVKAIYTKPIFTDGLNEYPAQAGVGFSFSTFLGQEENIEVSLELSRTEWNRTQTAPVATGISTAVSEESMVPLLFGGAYRFGKLKSKLRPYAGGEIGFTNQTLDATIKTPRLPDTTLTSNETKVTFGMKGGIQFILNDTMSIDLGYRYMVVGAASDEETANASSSGGTSKRNDGDSLSYHVVYLAGSFRF